MHLDSRLAIAAVSSATGSATAAPAAPTTAMPSSAAATAAARSTIRPSVSGVHGFAVRIFTIEVGFALFFREVPSTLKGNGLLAFTTRLCAMAVFSAGAVSPGRGRFAFRTRLLGL